MNVLFAGPYKNIETHNFMGVYPPVGRVFGLNGGYVSTF